MLVIAYTMSNCSFQLLLWVRRPHSNYLSKFELGYFGFRVRIRHHFDLIRDL